jgi:hypothetical protein
MVLPWAISRSAVLSLRMIYSAVYLVRFMVQSPAQSGLMGSLIHPGSIAGVHVNLISAIPLVSRRGSAGKKTSVKSFGVAWILAGCSAANNEISSPAWGLLGQSSLDAVVNALGNLWATPV